MEQKIAILTGDIVGSRKESPKLWQPALEEAIGMYSEKYDIYRGDSFQCELSLEEAFKAAFYIKMSMIALKLDARIGIGVGFKDYDSQSVKTSFGTALINSGEAFDRLKKHTLLLQSGQEETDKVCNIILSLLTEIAARWTPNIAQTLKMALLHEEANQTELAKKLQKKHQGQVSFELQKGSFVQLNQALLYCTQKLLEL
ncbi:hypothetical protein [Sphingobacterium sp. LRF_L2]|uniref:hypothetical protein n=1 Tax=Sphingobacterium sp. LRF_L2 TaxID=3369421 RepID=UPI003F6036CD